MALPAMKANTPSNGYVSWAAFTIKYHGGTFTVPAGNTNKRFTWWRYNTAAQTVVQTNLFTNPRATTTTGFTGSYAGGGSNVCTVAAVASLDAVGGWAARWSWSAKPGTAGDIGPLLTGAGLVAGTTYTIAYKVKAIQGGATNTPIMYSSAGVITHGAKSRAGSKTFLAGEVEQQWLTFSMDATAIASSPKVVEQITGTGVQDWEIFDVILVTGSTVPTYFDGNTPRAGTSYDTAWTGTADASSSQLLTVTPALEAGDNLPDGLTGSLTENPAYEQADPVDPTMAAEWRRGGWLSDNGSGTATLATFAGARAMALFPGASGSGVSVSTEKFIDVTPGETLYFAADVAASAACTGIYFRAARDNGAGGDGAEILGTSGLEDQSATTTYVRKSGTLVVPAGVTKIRPFALAHAPVGTTTTVYVKNYTVSRVALPNPLTPDDLFLFINKYGTPLNVQGTRVIDGSLIVSESILADSIGANQVTAPKILAGAIEAYHVKTNSLTSRTMAIGNFDNLFEDPTFEQEQTTDSVWPLTADWARVANQNRGGNGPVLRCTATAGDQIITNDPTRWYPIDTVDTPGAANASYFLSAIARSTVANTAGGIVVGARWLLENNTTVTTYVGDDQGGAANVYLRYKGIVTAPNGAKAVQFFIGVTTNLTTGTIDFDYVGANRAGVGELIVDGTISGQHLEAKSIRADHLSTDFFSSKFVLTGEIQIGDEDTVSPITLSMADGLKMPQPDGGLIHFPVDGRPAQITADVKATSLAVKTDLTINGKGYINGTVDLTAGVQAPVTKPTITAEWPSLLTSIGDGTSDISSIYHGLAPHASDSSKMVMAVNFFGAGIRVLNRADGTVGTYPDPTAGQSWCADFYPWSGIATVSGSYYMLGSDNNQNGLYLYRINGTTFAKTSQIQFSSNIFYTDKTMRLVTDGTEVGVVWTKPASGDLCLRWYKADLSGRSVTAGRTTDIVLVAGFGAANIGGCEWGTAGGATSRLWVTIKDGPSGVNVMAFNTSTWAPVTAEDFIHANYSAVIGLLYDAVRARMIHVDNVGKLHVYSAFVSGTPNIQACYTFYDGDNGNYPANTFINGVDKSGLASGAHETMPSPTATQTIPRRSWPRIECSAPPDETITDSTLVDKANRVGVYWNVVGTTMYRQAYLTTTAGVAQRVVSGIDVPPTTGTVPVSNGFSTALAAPGRLGSGVLHADGKPMARLDGDGSGRAGEYAWDTAGLATSAPKFPWMRRYRATTQTLATSAQFDTIDFATADGSSKITYAGAGTFTVPAAGLYLVKASVQFVGNATGRRIVRVIKGTSTEVARHEGHVSSAQQVTVQCVSLVSLAAGGTFRVEGWQNSGGSLGVNGDLSGTSCEVILLGTA